MLFKNSILEFLHDKKYYFLFYDDNIYIYKYKNILKYKMDNIIINFEKFKIDIKGNNLIIRKMSNDELIINGIFFSMRKIYE